MQSTQTFISFSFRSFSFSPLNSLLFHKAEGEGEGIAFSVPVSGSENERTENNFQQMLMREREKRSGRRKESAD